MAIRFPGIPKGVDPEKTHIDYSFDRLIACVKYGHAPGELWFAHGVAIDTNTDQIYIAEGYTGNIARVSIFSETGEFLNTFSHPDMKYPWGIAVHRDNVYITDMEAHSVFHFKVEVSKGGNFRLIVRQGGKGSGNGEFDQPCQLTVSTNGDLFVTDRNNDRLQILDSDLHYQRHISHHSMKLPIDVKLAQDEVYILSKTSPHVKVFSFTGDLIRSLVTAPSYRMHVDTPFFCLDANSNLLLCDHLEHQIKIFSNEGALLHTLGNYGHEVGMFVYPKGITLSNNQKLIIVSQNRNYSLQIFSYD